MKILKVDQVQEASSFIQRFVGFMFQSKPENKKVIIFNKCNSVHSFNMRFNLDVLFLDNSNKIIKKVSNLSRGKIISPVRGACVVVEAEAGMFDALAEGDIVAFDAPRFS